MTNKTLKQIADELGVDKQRVYRFVKKNHISEAHQSASTKLYDEAAQKLIFEAFSKDETHHEAHQKHINDAVVDTLLKQLEEKDKQIEQLLKALDQAQQLHAVAESKIAQLEAPAEKKRFSFFGGKS